MNKTLGYWLENLFSLSVGVIPPIICFVYWERFDFIKDSNVLDKIITISSVLFGFLLTILTLIIQGNSSTLDVMKKHGSFRRLVIFNKTTVISAIINCCLSIFLYFTASTILNESKFILKLLASINIGLLSFVIFNSLYFTIIFYRIITPKE